jgi:hypothetical protein
MSPREMGGWMQSIERRLGSAERPAWKPGIIASRNVSQSVGSPASNIVFTQIDVSGGTTPDPDNIHFTIPKEGWYEVQGFFPFATNGSSVAGTSAFIEVRVNGTAVSRGDFPITTAAITNPSFLNAQFRDQIRLQDDDVLSFYFGTTAGAVTEATQTYLRTHAFVAFLRD